MELHRFVAISATLTGYSAAELMGTGQAQAYLDEVSGAAGDGALLRLSQAVEQALTPGEGCEATRMNQLVLNDAASANGPLAKGIMFLWFTGTWQALTTLWHAQNGGDPQDQTRVVSSAAYREGLVWPTIGSHPQSAKQPGFGTWAMPPAPFEVL